MKEQKKQNLLTGIIIILIIILVLLVGSIIYEEKVNINKQSAETTMTPEIEEDNDIIVEDEEMEVETEVGVENEETVEEKEEYIGEEEQNTEQENNIVDEKPTKSNDEKAIDLAKKEWGQDDSVTFTIDQKQGNKYYVAVKSEATVLQWYEVNIDTWEINEYY